MEQEIKLQAEIRKTRGSTAARRIRRSGTLPAVLTTAVGETVMLAIDIHQFELILSRQVGENLMLNLEVDGKDTLTLLREIQRHGVSGKALHADFFEVRRDEKLQLRIPVQLEGEPYGVLNQNGLLDQVLREIEVECFPADIVDSFVFDVSGLKLADTLLVSDLDISDKFTLLTPEDSPIATVLELRIEEDLDAEDDADEEGAGDTEGADEEDAEGDSSGG